MCLCIDEGPYTSEVRTKLKVLATILVKKDQKLKLRASLSTTLRVY